MGKFSDAVKDSIREELENISSGDVGIVDSFERTSNTATVKIGSDKTRGAYKTYQLPWPQVTPGVKCVDPASGTRVFIEYRGDNKTLPYISSIMDESFKENVYTPQIDTNRAPTTVYNGLNISKQPLMITDINPYPAITPIKVLP